MKKKISRCHFSGFGCISTTNIVKYLHRNVSSQFVPVEQIPETQPQCSLERMIGMQFTQNKLVWPSHTVEITVSSIEKTVTLSFWFFNILKASVVVWTDLK